MSKRNVPPEITVIVSVYNVAHCVERCLSSLLAQTEGSFDLLVIDDGSTDESAERCRRMLAGRDRTRVLSLPHSGISAVRNYGLTQVQTEYVLFVDGDDYLAPDTVERLFRSVKTHSPDLVVFGFWYETEERRGDRGDRYPVAAKKGWYGNRLALENAFPDLWDAGVLYSICNKLFCTDLIRAHGLVLQERNFGEDFTFCREYLRWCGTCDVLGDCCYHYVSHSENSLSARFRADLFAIRVEEHMALIDYFSTVQCQRERAEEFLARRHIERVVGCIGNECDRRNPADRAQRRAHIRQMLDEPHTADCAKRARPRSVKMKLLVLPIRMKWSGLCFAMGCVMAECRAAFPKVFLWLKMHR